MNNTIPKEVYEQVKNTGENKNVLVQFPDGSQQDWFITEDGKIYKERG